MQPRSGPMPSRSTHVARRCGTHECSALRSLHTWRSLSKYPGQVRKHVMTPRWRRAARGRGSKPACRTKGQESQHSSNSPPLSGPILASTRRSQSVEQTPLPPRVKRSRVLGVLRAAPGGFLEQGRSERGGMCVGGGDDAWQEVYRQIKCDTGRLPRAPESY